MNELNEYLKIFTMALADASLHGSPEEMKRFKMHMLRVLDRIAETI